jgi:serine/threonine-protein phosphatase 6 regulatory ankyrin repeat subunit B
MLAELPETLDETYERILREINKANRVHAHRLLQCLTVAIRPLRVTELAEVLALDFETVIHGGTPKLNPDWRWEDQQSAVLSTCSSLISIVDEDDSQVVQFSHFSIKEYLTSSRLADSRADVSRYHILLEPAHTILAKACLGVLLRLDEQVDGDNVEKCFPLARYAAKHWVDHAKFEKVWSHVREAMEELFDPLMPCYTAWLRVSDIDVQRESRLYDFSGKSWSHAAAPLYYAALCRFKDLAKHLIVRHPEQVNTIDGRYVLPLAAALSMEDLDVAQLLYEHGAYVDVQGSNGRTPLYAAFRHPEIVEWLRGHGAAPNFRRSNDLTTLLHIAALMGQVEVFQTLLQHKAYQNVLDCRGRAPLHLASEQGRINVARLLLEHGSDVNAQDNSGSTSLHLVLAEDHIDIRQLLLEHGVASKNKDGETALHLAPRQDVGVTQLLTECGADVTAQNKDGWNPLHLALSWGQVEHARIFIQHGSGGVAQGKDKWTPSHRAPFREYICVAQTLFDHGDDVTAQDRHGLTPLHLASGGHMILAFILLEHGADATAQDCLRLIPMHLASSSEHAELTRILLEHGADPDARDNDNCTPLHWASEQAHPEVVRFILEHGVDADARDNDNCTPLHWASQHGHLEVASALVEHGVDVNARDHSNWTPLHGASQFGHLEVVQLLLKHGADPHASDQGRWTSLQWPSYNGDLEIVRVLLEHGADANTRDNNNWTPLHGASQRGHREVVQVLLEHGADENSRDDSNQTPLHLASRAGHLGLVQLLVESRAIVDVRNNEGRTPLEEASVNRHHDVMQLLLRFGGER